MMNDLEEIWEQSFSQLGYKLDLVKPNYKEMEHDDRMIASGKSSVSCPLKPK